MWGNTVLDRDLHTLHKPWPTVNCILFDVCFFCGSPLNEEPLVGKRYHPVEKGASRGYE